MKKSKRDMTPSRHVKQRLKRKPLGLAGLTKGTTISAKSMEKDLEAECPSCRGYGYFREDGRPTVDKRGRKCLDCAGTGKRPA